VRERERKRGSEEDAEEVKKRKGEEGLINKNWSEREGWV
jgi:hypothetical protein